MRIRTANRRRQRNERRLEERFARLLRGAVEQVMENLVHGFVRDTLEAHANMVNAVNVAATEAVEELRAEIVLANE